MLLLYAISVACFAALIAVGVAIVRHVRAGHREKQPVEPPPPSFTEHLYTATEYGSVRTPRQVPHQTVEGITARKAWNAPSQSMEIHPVMEDAVDVVTRNSVGREVRRAEFASNRPDWAHFNKDYGDLSDPHPSRPVRAASSGTLSRRRA